MRLLTLLAAMMLLFAGGCAPDAKPGTVTFTYASPYPATHPFSRADISWMAWLKQHSNGRILIKPYWGGALLSSNENMLEIRHRVADIGMVTPMYARSSHLQRIQPSFYSGIGTIRDQIDIYKCMAARFPEMDADTHGLHILAVQGGNFPGILTRNRPIRSLADIKGLRLRAQEDTAAVLRQLGADPVNMSMAEVYPAMAKGVIDGVVAPLDALRAVHLADVGKYYSTLRIARGGYPGRAMSSALWNSLSPADRALFDQAELVWEQAMVEQLAAALIAGNDYSRKEGIVFVPMPAAEQARFDALYRANTMKLARSLNDYGIDGVKLADHAVALIAARNAGQPLSCGATK
ncbi:TRAP transporter substrate-binding protein DctP [Sphingomonas sp. AR_OL41]|uniref:TRAP transporter substrate-binding protein DctP n=1 Tax=Sphingomonas sp. AR_OL41 TaxID=3042729 RepID=UPI0024808CBE|nr:TRAP transporter substrate-binding protein DctP [Sphingomonas sp. AR_OL41]MDH7974180.1 TRAP transporter substrate-binding protein DctP [Sphingomonas sp. AR_OL41]